MNIDVRTLIDLASAAHDFHKAHHRIDVAVAQRTDALGIHLHVDLQAAIPEGALIFGRVSGAWLGTLSGAKFLSNEEEGIIHNQASDGHHGTWHRRRIYTGVPAGDYVIGLECLSNVSGYYASNYGQGTLTVRDVQLLGDI